MNQFIVQFKNCPPLYCELHDTDLADKYYQLLKNQYQIDSDPIFRDPQKYTLQYFSTLAGQVKSTLGWDWVRPVYTIDVTTKLHKDLEKFLQNGFSQIPAEYDNLIHELHYALHAIESGSKRNHWLQIEWFNDNGFDLPEDQYPGKLNLEFGDLRLQNPYVGHHPLFVYEQKDRSNITQTCKFHDFVKPGINIVVKSMPNNSFSWEHYFTWFEKNSPEFVQLHGKETLKKFTGHPVIGKVVNLSDLEIVIATPVLEFEKIIFLTNKQTVQIKDKCYRTNLGVHR
jgi:hypothetical protein